MLYAYQVHSDAISDKVTFVARDSNEVSRFFWLWCQRHAAHFHIRDAEILRLTPTDLALQPQLAEAVSRGVIGVAWWAGHIEGWVVVAPDADPLGVVALRLPSVKCFIFRGDDCEGLHVVAENEEHAKALFNTWSLDGNGWEGEFSDMREVSLWMLTGAYITLREEMDEGLTGVAMICEDDCWRLFPADYDPPLTKRDGSVR
jgi:hypothetical protein